VTYPANTIRANSFYRILCSKVDAAMSALMKHRTAVLTVLAYGFLLFLVVQIA
jgi:hypothetical protein